MYIINVESGQLTRVPPARRRPRAAAADAGAAAGAAVAAAAAAWSSRATAARSTSAPAAASTRRPPAGGGRRRGGRRGQAADAAGAAARRRRGGNPGPAATNADGTAGQLHRQHRSRSQGAPPAGLQRRLAHHEEPLLRRQDAWRRLERGMGNLRRPARLPRRRGRAAHRHDDDDRPAQRVAHRRERRSAAIERTQQTRYPGFDLVPDASGFYKVGHVYKDGPADRDYLKIKEGHYVVSVDDHDLKSGDNYWQFFTLAPGTKFHFMVNDKPAKDGAWEVTITPIAAAHSAICMYAKWVTIAARSSTKAEQRRDRLPAHPRDGRAVAAAVPARSRRQPHEEGARHRSALQRRRRHRPGAARHPRRTPLPVHARPRRRLPACRGRRTSTARWW